MAKMTAAELIANLKIMGKMKDDMLLKIMPKQCSQIAAIIEQQQQQIEQLTQANAEMILRLTIDAMRELTSEQIDEVCQRIIKKQGVE